MARSLVTGGSGFIGSHVVDALCEAGHEVVILDRERPHERLDVKFVAGDIGDADALTRASEGVDFIHHVAALSNVSHAFDQPLECVETNVLGTANVLEAARRANVRRVFLASTVSVYDSAPDASVDETTPLHMPGPGHVYTSSKITCELLFNDYASLYRIPTTVFRYGIPYGPRMRPELLIPSFLRRAIAGQPLLVAGDGQQARNFVYVEDIARAHVLGLADSCENQTFNLAGAQSLSVLQVAEWVRELVGAHVAIEHTPGRPGAYAAKHVSREKAAELLGWTAEIPFDEGMRRTFAWYRAMLPATGQTPQHAAIA
jgi:UDP-glucose 4-epimerase